MSGIKKYMGKCFYEDERENGGSGKNVTDNIPIGDVVVKNGGSL